jgi:hypothetical protein
MNVRLKPLDGKYYGTVVELLDGLLKGNEIKIWLNTRDWEANDGHEPSDRELVYN